MKTQASNSALNAITQNGRRESLKNKIEAYFINNIDNVIFKGRTIGFFAMTFDEERSTITARLSELMESGKVYENGCKGKFTLYKYETNEAKRKIHAKKYKDRLFHQYVESGLRKYKSRMSPELIVELEKLI